MDSDHRSRPLLLLGASGWIAHYVLQFLREHHPDVSVIHASRSNPPPGGVLGVIGKFRPRIVLNLSRGETELDFLVHRQLIEAANEVDSAYYFASSFNACDADISSPHLESKQADAESDYGMFKARCEEELIRSSKRYGIFRFSATHGWAPGEIKRTEEFLGKLSAGDCIAVDRGILQNRTAVLDLAGMMVDLMLLGVEGIMHLGSAEPTDEVDFLRMLAVAFGYPADRVREAGNDPTNAFMVPGKLYEHFGDKWKRTDEDTIGWVSQQPELQRYRNQVPSSII